VRKQTDEEKAIEMQTSVIKMDIAQVVQESMSRAIREVSKKYGCQISHVSIDFQVKKFRDLYGSDEAITIVAVPERVSVSWSRIEA